MNTQHSESQPVRLDWIAKQILKLLALQPRRLVIESELGLIDITVSFDWHTYHLHIDPNIYHVYASEEGRTSLLGAADEKVDCEHGDPVGNLDVAWPKVMEKIEQTALSYMPGGGRR